MHRDLTDEEDTLPLLDDLLGDLAHDLLIGDVIGGDASASGDQEGCPPHTSAHTPDDDSGSRAGLGDRDLLRRLVETLTSTPMRLDPLCVFNVHTTRGALRDGHGVARVEELGPQSLAALQRWLGAQGSGLRIRVRPVIDPDQTPPVDRYEIPTAMRQGVEW